MALRRRADVGADDAATSLRCRADGAAMALRRRADVTAMALRRRSDVAATALRRRCDVAPISPLQNNMRIPIKMSRLARKEAVSMKDCHS